MAFNLGDTQKWKLNAIKEKYSEYGKLKIFFSLKR